MMLFTPAGTKVERGPVPYINVGDAKNLLDVMESSVAHYNHTALRLFISNFIKFHLQPIMRWWIASRYGENRVDEVYKSVEFLTRKFRVEKVNSKHLSSDKSKRDHDEIAHMEMAKCLIQDFLIEVGSDAYLDDQMRDIFFRFAELSKDDIPYAQEL